MDKLQENSEMRRRARRRLIKGSFAAPAALTLCSGSALAASSNSRCINTSAAKPDRPGPNPAATWVRVQAKRESTGAPNPVASDWITYEQLFALLGSPIGNVNVKDGIGVSLTPGQALCVMADAGSGGTLNRIATRPVGATLPGGYYAILINNKGDIVGISSVTSVSGGAVSNDCWHSFGGLTP